MEPQHPRERRRFQFKLLKPPRLTTRCTHGAAMLSCAYQCGGEVVDLRPAIVLRGGVVGVEYRSGETVVGRSTESVPAGVELTARRRAAVPVEFRSGSDRDGGLEFGPLKVGGTDTAVAHYATESIHHVGLRQSGTQPL